MKLNQFAFLRAFGRWFSSQIEPPIECFFNSMKDIPGYEGLYAVTTDGRVWSYPKKGKGGHKTGFFMKQTMDRFGYFRINLSDYKGDAKKIRIHRLVALTYIPNPDNKPQVNHKNGIRTDNRVENFEWVTLQENILHGYRSNGTLPHTSIKTVQKTLEGEVIGVFKCIKHASEATGISYSHLINMFRGKIQNTTGFLWEFSPNNYEK